MTSSKVGLVLAVLAAATAGGAQAQREPSLQVGAPVRISGLDVPGSPLTGMYAGRVGDTVLIGIPGGSDAIRVPRRAVTHLEVQLGMRSGAARISVLGLLAGTAAAGAVALAVRAAVPRTEPAGGELADGALGPASELARGQAHDHRANIRGAAGPGNERGRLGARAAGR